VLFALGEPFVFIGLLLSFPLALVLRAVAIRFAARSLGLVDRREPLAPRLREDIDAFGAVGTLLVGVTLVIRAVRAKPPVPAEHAV
jgi:hypothetical protein